MTHKILYLVVFSIQLALGFCTVAFAQGELLSPAKNGDLQSRYNNSIALFKDGKSDEALRILEALILLDPEESSYLNDYIAIASWSGKHDLALAISGQIDLNAAPAYVLETIGASQQHQGQQMQALETYSIAVKRFPERIDSRIGRIQVLMGLQNFKKAASDLLVMQRDYPDRVEMWDVGEQLERFPNQSTNALSLSQHILKSHPQNEFALRMRFHALIKLGAVHLAIEKTPESVMSETERLEVHRERLVKDLGWAGIKAGKSGNSDRWHEMDAAITGLRSMCNTAGRGSDAEYSGAVCGDLLIALVERGSRTEAIALYESMREKRWVIPSYVTFYAASAYLDERQPESARILLAAELPFDKGNVDARINYVYALMDCGQYVEAYHQIDQLAAETTEIGNPGEYVRVHLTGAMVRSYTDRLAEAQNRLESLADRAPFNAEIGRALAYTYALRGWHRLAENEWLKWSAIEPGNVAGPLGLFENRMAISDFRGAQTNLQSAIRLDPENKDVLNAQRSWSNHQQRELIVDLKYGESKDGGAAGANGSHEYLIDTRVYGAPYRDDWRFFGHAQTVVAAYPGVNIERVSMGGGTEYRIRDAQFSGELFNMGKNGMGLSLEGEYRFDDQWSVHGQADINSLSAPVRAYTDNDSADLLQLRGAYRWHESRNLTLSIGQMNFSDGNLRRSEEVSWEERLLNLPNFKIDVTLEYASSHNSTQSPQINYFNPIDDRYQGVTLQSGWLQLKHGERSLRHDLSISLGRYTQRDFNSDRVVSLQYEPSYQVNDRLEFRAGIGRTLHPYDGVVDASNNVSGGVNWKF